MCVRERSHGWDESLTGKKWFITNQLKNKISCILRCWQWWRRDFSLTFLDQTWHRPDLKIRVLNRKSVCVHSGWIKRLAVGPVSLSALFYGWLKGLLFLYRQTQANPVTHLKNVLFCLFTKTKLKMVLTGEKPVSCQRKSSRRTKRY